LSVHAKDLFVLTGLSPSLENCPYVLNSRWLLASVALPLCGQAWSWRRKRPHPQAGGRVRTGPEWQSTSIYRPVHSAVWEKHRRRYILLSHTLGPIPLGRSALVRRFTPDICLFAPEICLMEPCQKGLVPAGPTHRIECCPRRCPQPKAKTEPSDVIIQLWLAIHAAPARSISTARR
jgi:hypothetical protein